jgi:hypothetical protein
MNTNVITTWPRCFFLFYFGVIISSCGLENYIYLAPVTAITAQNNSISVTLPNGDQPSLYFKGYKIYYKIYTSSKTYTSVISSANFSEINSTMNSDYSKIAPYLSTDSVASINMDVFFSSSSYGLNFYPLYYNENNSNLEISKLLDGSESTFILKKDKNEFKIELSTPYSFSLRRSIANYPAFTYNSSDMSNDADVAYISNNTTAYALFFIFAYGVDEYGSSIFSRPTMLGVLQLPNANN